MKIQLGLRKLSAVLKLNNGLDIVTDKGNLRIEMVEELAKVSGADMSVSYNTDEEDVFFDSIEINTDGKYITLCGGVSEKVYLEYKNSAEGDERENIGRYLTPFIIKEI